MKLLEHNAIDKVEEENFSEKAENVFFPIVRACKFIFYVIICFIAPIIFVAIKGNTDDLIKNLILSFFFYVPAVIHAIGFIDIYVDRKG